MKPLCTLVFYCLALSGYVVAQEGPPYGPVGLVAISNESDRGPVMQFANGLSDVLHKEEKVSVRGDVQFVPAGVASDDEVVKLAVKLSVEWLVVTSLKPSDFSKDQELLSIEVLHSVSGKIVSGAAALVRKVRTVGSKVGEEIYNTAVTAAHAVTTFVSQFKEVWVILQFLSSPVEANYVFGKSASKVTDKNGAGYWEDTQPVGKTNLRVWKPEYSTETVSIDIPAQGSVSYVVPLQVITLRLTTH